LPTSVDKALDQLAAYLESRRDELLRLWREAVSRDPEVASNPGLSRTLLEDHMPDILADFVRRLRAEHALHAMQAELQHRRDAAEHGMQRWQQGYDIRETMREWGHLQSVMLHELARYAARHPNVQPSVMETAREVLTKLCMEGNCESATRYMQMQQAEATSRMRDLESSLRALQALEDERARLLRETAHDLRGNASVIANATTLLAKPQVAGPERDRFYELLQQRIRSMGAMLTDLAELARIEAGQDPLKIESYDAAERVRGFCEVLRPVAAARNLFLKYEGLDTLPVEGDLLKLQRIVQNLLVNALQVTERGGIVVRALAEGTKCWIVSVEDTGPGFPLQAAGELRHALKRATDEAHRVDVRELVGKGETRAHEPATMPAATDPGTAEMPSGEGIGLSIVKRLCDVLGATLDLETAPGHGTTFRVTFPVHYATRTEVRD
jgi:signal transduction histidine kinase